MNLGRTLSWSPLLMATALLVATPACADTEDYANPDRPGIADGSTAIGPGRFQVEAGLQQEMRKTDNASNHRLFTPLLLRFWLTDCRPASKRDPTSVALTELIFLSKLAHGWGPDQCK
jgi:hypothetical protein